MITQPIRPSIKFTNEDGTLTPEAYRYVNELMLNLQAVIKALKTAGIPIPPP